jgi:hypothetical protein
MEQNGGSFDPGLGDDGPGAATLRRVWLEALTTIGPAADLPGLRALIDTRLGTLDHTDGLDERSLLGIAEEVAQLALEEGSGADLAHSISRRLRRAIYEFLLYVDAAPEVAALTPAAPPDPSPQGRWGEVLIGLEEAEAIQQVAGPGAPLDLDEVVRGADDGLTAVAAWPGVEPPAESGLLDPAPPEATLPEAAPSEAAAPQATLAEAAPPEAAAPEAAPSQVTPPESALPEAAWSEDPVADAEGIVDLAEDAVARAARLRGDVEEATAPDAGHLEPSWTPAAPAAQLGADPLWPRLAEAEAAEQAVARAARMRGLIDEAVPSPVDVDALRVPELFRKVADAPESPETAAPAAPVPPAARPAATKPRGTRVTAARHRVSAAAPPVAAPPPPPSPASPLAGPLPGPASPASPSTPPPAWPSSSPPPGPWSAEHAAPPPAPPAAASPTIPEPVAPDAPSAFPIAPREGFHLTDPSTIEPLQPAPAPVPSPWNLQPAGPAEPSTSQPPAPPAAPTVARSQQPEARRVPQVPAADQPAGSGQVQSGWSVRQSPRQQMLAERMAQKRREEAVRAAQEAAALAASLAEPERQRGGRRRRGEKPKPMPDLATARELVGEELQRKRCPEAAALLQRAAQEHPGRETADFALDSGDRCLVLGQSRAATNCYLAAWRADPAYEAPLWRLADLCLADRQVNLATGYLERVAELTRSRGDDEGALAVYRRIVAVDPGREDIRRLVRLAQTSGRLDG